MLLKGAEINLTTILVYSAILFGVQLLCHYIPKVCKMGDKGERWMLIVFFGLCLGVAFNMVIPGSLHIVTDAWESYENSTEIEELNRMYHLIRRLDYDDDDDDDDGFRRIIGVAICVGFMVLFLADYISKEVTKKQRVNEVSLPLVDGAQPKLPLYTNGALENLYVTYYILSAVGCMSAYLVCDNEHQRTFILIAQFICMLPSTCLFGRQMIRQNVSTGKCKYLILPDI